MRKQLAFRDSNGKLGKLGEDVGFGLHIGDVLSVYWNDKIITNVICKNENSRPFLMGLGGHTLEDLLFNHKAKLVIPYSLLNEDILNYIDNVVVIEEISEVEMTITEIEEKLGYKIKVVSE